MATTWRERAEQAIEAGYVPGNNWQRMLERHLRRCFPALVGELGSDLESYLIVQTFNAIEMACDLEDAGMDTATAEELVMAELLKRPPDEVDLPEAWEVEDGVASATSAAERRLSGPSRPGA